MESWADGRFTAESAEGTAQLNAKMLGCIQLIDMIMGLEGIETDEE